MNDSNKSEICAADDAAFQRKQEVRRWWIRLLVQPALFLLCGALLIAGLGVVQRMGFITAGGGGHSHGSALSKAIKYICPMMCTPPQSEPGRCPVCAMELHLMARSQIHARSTLIPLPDGSPIFRPQRSNHSR